MFGAMAEYEREIAFVCQGALAIHNMHNHAPNVQSKNQWLRNKTYS